jgi:two-component system, cell cycle response regulator
MKVLYAEDDPGLRSGLTDILQSWGHEVNAVDNGLAAWEALQQDDPPRLALLDWMMPGMDGVEICRRLRQEEHQPYVYLIILTGKTEQQDIVMAIESGANDYITKPFQESELRVRLQAGQRIIELQEALHIRATRDFLTGVWNRGMIIDFLGRELARSQRHHTPVGVAMLDLDWFKKVNDTYGHQTGDEVLKETACRLAAQLRPFDALGRYGGEEFLVVLPGCSLTDVYLVGGRLRQSMNEAPVATTAGPVPVTISLGVTAASGHDNIDVDGILRTADEALYEAKHEGRNRVAVKALP